MDVAEEHQPQAVAQIANRQRKCCIVKTFTPAGESPWLGVLDQHGLEQVGLALAVGCSIAAYTKQFVFFQQTE